LGSVLFIALLLRPLLPRLGSTGPDIEGTCIAIAAWSAFALVACTVATVALQSAVLVGTVDLTVAEALGANFAIAGLIKATAAALVALTLFTLGRHASVTALLALSAIILIAATLTTHAAARLQQRTPLLFAEFLHQFGAAIWVGGIPCFLVALGQVRSASTWRAVGARFSRMSMVGVGCIALSGFAMTVGFIGSFDALYGTAYGVMVGAKIAMFLMLLALGGGNFLLIERLRSQSATPVIRLKRYAEVEIGIGVAIFFAAASLTSVPPAIDLTQDRVTWPEIIERNTPQWPRLTSPDHEALALPALQAKLDAEAAGRRAAPQAAFVPGSGELPPRNAADIAWSEYNHHWSACCRCCTRRGFAGRVIGRCCLRCWRHFCSCARTRRSGRSVMSAFSPVCATRRYCSIAYSCCWWPSSVCSSGGYARHLMSSRGHRWCSRCSARSGEHCC